MISASSSSSTPAPRQANRTALQLLKRILRRAERRGRVSQATGTSGGTTSKQCSTAMSAPGRWASSCNTALTVGRKREAHSWSAIHGVEGLSKWIKGGEHAHEQPCRKMGGSDPAQSIGRSVRRLMQNPRGSRPSIAASARAGTERKRQRHSDRALAFLAATTRGRPGPWERQYPVPPLGDDGLGQKDLDPSSTDRGARSLFARHPRSARPSLGQGCFFERSADMGDALLRVG